MTVEETGETPNITIASERVVVSSWPSRPAWFGALLGFGLACGFGFAVAIGTAARWLISVAL